MQSVQQQQAPISSSVVQAAGTGLAGVAPPAATTQQGTGTTAFYRLF